MSAFLIANVTLLSTYGDLFSDIIQHIFGARMVIFKHCYMLHLGGLVRKCRPSENYIHCMLLMVPQSHTCFMTVTQMAAVLV